MASEFYEQLLHNSSLIHFFNNQLGLVDKPPQLSGYQNLIDWPDAIDSLATGNQTTCCRDGYVDGNISTAINAHVMRAARRMAELAGLIGRDSAEIAGLHAIADRIASQLLSTAVLEGHSACGCEGPCFRDSASTTHAASPATMYALACGVLPPNATNRFLPFLMVRNYPAPQFSAQSAAWMFEALFKMSAGGGESQASDWAFRILTSAGHRSLSSFACCLSCSLPVSQARTASLLFTTLMTVAHCLSLLRALPDFCSLPDSCSLPVSPSLTACLLLTHCLSLSHSLP